MLKMHETKDNQSQQAANSKEWLNMIEIGMLCVKIAGRDAGLKCVIVDDLGKGMVLIDGQTRRRKCNLRHLEVLGAKLKIKKNASHDEISKEFKKLDLSMAEPKKKAKQKTSKPSKQRAKSKSAKSEAPHGAKEPKEAAKEEKKESKKTEKKAKKK